MSKKPFVLLVTSEELNPSNLFSSCFELNLAHCLVKEYEVAIMSVSHDGSAIAQIKNLLRKPSFAAIASIFGYLRKLLFTPIEVKHHSINNITVKEVVGRYWFSGAKTPVAALMKWVELGRKGFYRTYPTSKEQPKLVHAHSRFLMATYLAYTIKQQSSIPYIYTEHSTFYQRNRVDESLKPYVTKAVNHSSFFTAVSTALYHTVDGFIGGIKVPGSVVYNALDEIYQQPLKRTNTHVPVLINIASLEEKKNQVAMIKAGALLRKQYPNLQMQFVGSSMDMEPFMQLVKDEGVEDRVQFLGQRTPTEIVKLLDASTVFVLPSLFETFGVVVIEALSRGVPIVVTKCGGPEEYFQDFTGEMVASFDAPQLAAAIDEVLKNYNAYSPLQIRDYCLSKFGNEAILQQHGNIYKKVLGNA